MPTQRLEFHVSYSRLLIGLLVTVVPISLVGLYAITKSDSELRQTVGTHFKIFAESTASEVSQFIHDRVMNVGSMALEPTIRSVIQVSNNGYQGVSEDAIAARVSRIEDGWNTAASNQIVERILSSDASVWLRRYQELDPRFLRITVTDVRGVTVAATHKTLDYLQGDEDFWQDIYAQGRGAVVLTDVLYDDVTKSSYIGIGVPVVEPDTNRFVGTIQALVDITSLFLVVNRSHPPLNLRTTLVKDDGTVISAPEVDLSMKMESQEFLAVQDALRTIEGRQTGYIVRELPNVGRRLIGFADTGLKEDYRNLAWIVLVSQDADEAFASIRLVGRLTGFLALVGLAMVMLVAMYFSLHRHVPFEEAHQLDDSAEDSSEVQAG